MKNVAIIGPGLLGASIGLALRQNAGARVSVWARRNEAARQAVELGAADLGSNDLEEVASAADLVILCTPVGSMPALARQLAPVLQNNPLVTDVGSVKVDVVACLSAVFRGHARFIGSHPMAGSEQSGMLAARHDLFANALCILTPEADSDPGAVRGIAEFWEDLGCRIRTMPAPDHDQSMALVSHFPHLLAASLVEMVMDQNPSALDLCGPGFRDSTRIASGPPAMWAEILHNNRVHVKKTAEAMVEKLRELITLLDSDCPEASMHKFLTQAKAHRDRVRQTR